MVNKYLNEVVFPIYKIRDYREITIENNIKYIHTYKGTYIFDDLNLSGNYANRRAHILFYKDKYKYKLYPINVTYTDYSFIGNNRDIYMDNNGNMFYLYKEKYYKIKSYKVKRVIPMGTHCLVQLYGLYHNFYVKSVKEIKDYLSVLNYNHALILIKFTDNEEKTRKVML